MTSNVPDLGQLQRWMQAVIMHPEGVARGIASEGARTQVDVSVDDIERVVTRSRALTSVERLQVYGSAYFARLLEVMRDEFPALRHALGDETFDAFAFGYIRAYPSHSYTLASLSADFPRYLEETRPPESVDSCQLTVDSRKREARTTDDSQLTTEPHCTPSAALNADAPVWSDFVIELARLERTYSEVFDGPGPERGRLLTPDDLQSIPADRWAGVRLIPVESLRLMTFRFPVHEYASAVRSNREPELPQPALTYLVVNRRAYVVRRQAVTKPQFELLRAILAGRPLGEAIQSAVENSEADLHTLAGQLRDWFRRWSAAQYFRGVEMPAD